MEAPCKECERRYVNCHSKCSDYKSWKGILARKKEASDKAKESYTFFREEKAAAAKKKGKRK